jgi:hypothetical protein
LAEPPEETARFVGGPEDGLRVSADHPGERLPPHFVADGGDRPVGYRLVPGEPGTEWLYVVDKTVADAYMIEMWGATGAAAYERVLAETGDTKRAWEAAKAVGDS